jgi:hypothetical protein
MQTENEDDDVSEEEIYRDGRFAFMFVFVYEISKISIIDLDVIVSNNLSTELVQSKYRFRIVRYVFILIDSLNQKLFNGRKTSIR